MNESNGSAVAEDTLPSLDDLTPDNPQAEAESAPAPAEAPPEETVASPEDGSDLLQDGPAIDGPPSPAEDRDGGEEEDDGVLIQIQEQTRELQRLRQVLMEDNKALDTAKKKVKTTEGLIDEAQQELEDLILCREPGPLFEHAKREADEETDEASGDRPMSAPTVEVAPASPEEDLSWRDAKIEDLDGLSPGLVKNLNAANIHTMGNLADFTNPSTNGGRQNVWTDVSGVGPKAVEKIEKATEVFWSNWKAARELEARQAAANQSAPAESAAPEEMENPESDHDNSNEN